MNSDEGTSVEQYFNVGYTYPTLFNPNEATIGITNSAVKIEDSKLICSFNRDNSNSDERYFNLNTKSPFVIVAFGRVNGISLKFFFIV